MLDKQIFDEIVQSLHEAYGLLDLAKMKRTTNTVGDGLDADRRGTLASDGLARGGCPQRLDDPVDLVHSAAVG